MKIELTSLHGLNIYTDKGSYVGTVDDVIIDPNEKKISGLAVGNVNTNMFEVDGGVIIPYRWVTAIGDVILMKEIQTNKTSQPESTE